MEGNDTTVMGTHTYGQGPQPSSCEVMEEYMGVVSQKMISTSLQKKCFETTIFYTYSLIFTYVYFNYIYMDSITQSYIRGSKDKITSDQTII